MDAVVAFLQLLHVTLLALGIIILHVYSSVLSLRQYENKFCFSQCGFFRRKKQVKKAGDEAENEAFDKDPFNQPKLTAVNPTGDGEPKVDKPTDD